MSRVAALLFAAAAATEVHDVGTRSVGVQLFQWPFRDIARECEFLARAGYGWVQTSPVQPHVNESYGGDIPWWIVYQPLALDIGNRLGSEADLDFMLTECRRHGVAVVVDVVLNHGPITGKKPTVGCFGCKSQDWDTTDYRPGSKVFRLPDFGYTAADTHAAFCTNNIGDGPNGWEDPWSLWNCRLGGLADLDTGAQRVRTNARNFLDRLLRKGAAGFRVDAAKHMAPADLAAMLQGLCTNDGKAPFVGAEVWGGFPDPNAWAKYLEMGRVYDFDYVHIINEAFSQPAHNLRDSLATITRSRAPGPLAITFVENHDTERLTNTEAASSSKHPGSRAYKQAIAFNLLWAHGNPIVHSGYWFDTRDRGPPIDYANRGSVKGPGTPNPADSNIFAQPWAGQHRWAQVFPLVSARNWMYADPTYKGLPELKAAGTRFIHWAAPGRVFAAINAHPTDTWEANVPTQLPPGTYCNLVHARAVAGVCQPWPGVAATAYTHEVATDGTLRVRIAPTDPSQVIVLSTQPDGQPRGTNATASTPAPTCPRIAQA